MKRRVKRIKKFRLIPIIFLFSVVLIATICFVYKNNYLKTKVSPTPTANPSQTVNWLTYTNTKYNFSFKFPGSFGGQGSISGPTTGTVDSLRSFTDPKTLSGKAGARFDGFSLYMVTKPGTTNLDK